MKKKTPPTLFLALLLFANITFSTKAQELMIEIPLETQVKSSIQIIEGKVTNKTSFWDRLERNIYTVNTIEVFKVFKGQTLNETIEIITPGGIVGNNAEIVTPSLSLNIGEIGLFMLNSSTIDISNGTSHKKYRTYGASQGFYKYNLSLNTAQNPFVNIQDIPSTFYKSIQTFTSNESINEISNFDVHHAYNATNLNRSPLGTEVISNFTPTVLNGGVRDVLTINGVNFGNTKGTVKFRDANFNISANQYYTAIDSQVLTWTNNQITVEVPSRAGTGDFQVITSTGTVFTSNEDLTVFYSQTNISTSTNLLTTQHVDSNSSGGYTWQMHTEFDANTAAKSAFLRAFESWVCTTGINWELGTVTSVDAIDDDDVNVIRFDNGTELPQGILGLATTRFLGCNNPASPGGLDFFVEELDIVFNDVFIGGQAAFSWQFGPGTAGNLEIDFESVALHELGHAHLLAHIIDSDEVMHYSLINGQTRRNLGPSALDAANDVMDRNLNVSPCTQNIMTVSDCSSLTVNDWTQLDDLLIYPNPATTNLTVSSVSNTQLDTASIYDVRGKLVLTKTLKTNSNSLEVSVLQSGVYFITITSKNKATTRKFVIK